MYTHLSRMGDREGAWKVGAVLDGWFTCTYTLIEHMWSMYVPRLMRILFLPGMSLLGLHMYVSTYTCIPLYSCLVPSTYPPTYSVYMYIYICTYIHTYTQRTQYPINHAPIIPTHIHTYIHMYILPSLLTQIHTRIHTYKVHTTSPPPVANPYPYHYITRTLYVCM